MYRMQESLGLYIRVMDLVTASLSITIVVHAYSMGQNIMAMDELHLD